MRNPSVIVLAASAALLLPSYGIAAQSGTAGSAECAKLAARFDEVAKTKANSPKWMAGEYYATEGKSYCETGRTSEGAQAYKKALSELGVSS